MNILGTNKNCLQVSHDLFILISMQCYNQLSQFKYKSLLKNLINSNLLRLPINNHFIPEVNV